MSFLWFLVGGAIGFLFYSIFSINDSEEDI